MQNETIDTRGNNPWCQSTNEATFNNIKIRAKGHCDSGRVPHAWDEAIKIVEGFLVNKKNDDANKYSINIKDRDVCFISVAHKFTRHSTCRVDMQRTKIVKFGLMGCTRLSLIIQYLIM